MVFYRLGDRHGENILFDSITGDTVHVDFNCLFDKGRTFDIAEQVPFRLTHNLVAGLGVSGVEGVFRKACEVTMSILRDNKDSLMSVLETFVHDPLVDWIPGGPKKKVRPSFSYVVVFIRRDPCVLVLETDNRCMAQLDAPTEEYVAKEAKRCLDPIDRKLTGHQITSAPSGRTERQTSTENQVDSLINEARDRKNLVRNLSCCSSSHASRRVSDGLWKADANIISRRACILVGLHFYKLVFLLERLLLWYVCFVKLGCTMYGVVRVSRESLVALAK